MRRRSLASLLACVSLSLVAQTIRVTVDLVQVDAVVTDDQGHHVANLEAKDFVILEDGKPQQITHFSYEHSGAIVAAGKQPPLRSAAGKASVAPMLPAKSLQRGEVQRSIVLLIDDLGLSASEIPRVRSTVKNFVNAQMQPGDLASIMTTSGGTGVMEQFTTDKRLLNAAIDRVHYASGRNGFSSFEAVHELQPTLRGQVDTSASLSGFRNMSLTLGTLSSLSYAIDGLSEMPGRKAVAVFSDGFIANVQGVVERANRASVVLYTFDARGIEASSLSAIDSIYASHSSLNLGSTEQARRRDFVEKQRGMAQLAQGTGGVFFHDNNGLNEGLTDALDDMGSFYLIGYQPHRESFNQVKGVTQFHRIEVKVLTRGLHVRSRNGFMGVPDSGGPARPLTADEQLRHALFSPFQVSDIPLHLSAFYSAGERNAKTGLRSIALRAMMTVDPRSLTFTDTPDGKKMLSVDIIASAYNALNRAVGTSSKRFSGSMTEAEMKGLVSSGMVYSLNIDVPAAGAYQIRAAARDSASERTGSASYFLQIPDFNGKHIALSSVLLHDDDAARNEAASRAGSIGAGSTITRVFAQGAVLTYECDVFGAVLDKAAAKPKIDIGVHLFHGEEHIFSGQPIPVAIPTGSPASVRVTGQIKLPATLPPGNYVAELIAFDRLDKTKQQQTAQWVDFTLVQP